MVRDTTIRTSSSPCAALWSEPAHHNEADSTALAGFWRRSNTRRTAIEPSPIAVGARFTDPLRTSPTQKTPGRLSSTHRAKRGPPSRGRWGGGRREFWGGARSGRRVPRHRASQDPAANDEVGLGARASQEQG